MRASAARSRGIVAFPGPASCSLVLRASTACGERPWLYPFPPEECLVAAGVVPALLPELLLPRPSSSAWVVKEMLAAAGRQQSTWEAGFWSEALAAAPTARTVPSPGCRECPQAQSPAQRLSSC